jgi:hypothetical protein
MFRFIENEISIPYNIVHNHDVNFVPCFSLTNLPVCVSVLSCTHLKPLKLTKNIYNWVYFGAFKQSGIFSWLISCVTIKCTV